MGEGGGIRYILKKGCVHGGYIQKGSYINYINGSYHVNTGYINYKICCCVVVIMIIMIGGLSISVCSRDAVHN